MPAHHRLDSRHAFSLIALLSTSSCGTRTNLDGYTQPQDQHPYVVAISAADLFACSLWSNGTVRCWGDDTNDRVSAGSHGTRPYTPVLIEEIPGGVVGLSAGLYRTCVVMNEGSVRCWGQRYDSSKLDIHPAPVGGLSDIQSLSTGYFHSCAVVRDGTVRCWGGNANGQLGNGSVTMDEKTTPPGPVLNLSDVESVATSSGHSCALMRDRTVRCWGSNYKGLLGDGTGKDSAVPVIVGGLSGVRKIATGEEHTCALLVDGTVRCWGQNDGHQLGTGDYVARTVPVEVQGLANVTDIAAGSNHSCAALADGTVRCWGVFGSVPHASGGEVVDTHTSKSSVPVAIEGLSRVQQLTAGEAFSCALLDDHSVRCWGVNDLGQLGDGTPIDSNVPVEVEWE